MRYDTPLTPQGDAIAKLPMRQQLRQGLKEMGKASLSSGRNFGLIGAVFAGTECCIEGVSQHAAAYTLGHPLTCPSIAPRTS